jgi:anti-sigma-K factor RskA
LAGAAVTVEPAGGSPQPTSAIIVSGTVSEQP